MGAKRPIAVFDVDGTIFRSSLVLKIVERAIEKGIFPKASEALFNDAKDRYLCRKGSWDDYINGVVQAYRQSVAGRKVEDIVEISEEVVNENKEFVYYYTRTLVTRLRPTHFLLAISHSPHPAVKKFCKEWGFHKVYASFYKDVDGIFTSERMWEEFIQDKGKLFKIAVEKNDLTLKGSVGVGDASSDIPFLKLVERPIAFNPAPKLFNEAQKQNWEIVVERKDMVYHFRGSLLEHTETFYSKQ